MVTLINSAPPIRPDRDRPRNMTGLVLCSLLALPFWAAVFAIVF